MSGENENASLPQLKEMAERIANVLSLDDSCRADDVGRIAARLAPLYAELERLARYETELERAASLLQGLISIGQVKAIGLLEVAAGVERLGQEKSEDIDRMRKLLGECKPDLSYALRVYTYEPDELRVQNLLTRIDAETGGK